MLACDINHIVMNVNMLYIAASQVFKHKNLNYEEVQTGRSFW